MSELSPKDKLSFEASIEKGDDTGYCTVYFTREFFDSAMHPQELFVHQVYKFMLTSLARFLDMEEADAEKLLQEGARPHTKEREG